ncbi:phospholipase A2 family protein [Aquibacillus albus]|uniref:Phospholipase A2-like domain-containing protein n=1 Tax=Aquibacillus albus TaxID=1168171 RepID=A0ABS2MXZ9_9BACI|nr:phospholipase A2 family protein [Aquibacillus albus]MBM7570770.1 hypothetical protein [Aquibacillus albus]
MNRWRRRQIRRRPGLCLPGYRWCGPGCSGPGEPVNEVDNCCKDHDDCYRKYGSSRKCDELLLDCLQNKLDNRSPSGRDARLIYNFIKFRNLFRF